MHTCIYLYYICTNRYIYIYIYVCVCVCVCVCVFIYVSIHIHICVYNASVYLFYFSVFLSSSFDIYLNHAKQNAIMETNIIIYAHELAAFFFSFYNFFPNIETRTKVTRLGIYTAQLSLAQGIAFWKHVEDKVPWNWQPDSNHLFWRCVLTYRVNICMNKQIQHF